MKIFKTRNVKTPNRANPGDAGLDFFIPEDLGWDEKTLQPNEDINIPSGIKVKFSEQYSLIAFNKSGQATKKSLQVGASVIDSSYQGEIHIHVRNIGRAPVTISKGEKIIQFLLIPVISEEIIESSSEAELFESSSKRGSGGFGSTGI